MNHTENCPYEYHRYNSVSHTALVSRILPNSASQDIHKPHSVICFAASAIWRPPGILVSFLRNILSMERKKAASLATLVLQTTCLVLTMRYSRISQVSGPRYLSSTVVVLSEIIKIIACVIMIYTTHERPLMVIKTEVLNQLKETVKLSVPSGLYTIQNNLQFVAVSNLDAATFQVTYQLKILTTAVFSVIFLRRRLDGVKWLSLVLLTIGVALVQIPKSDDVTTDRRKTSQSSFVGFSAVIVMCLSSGFAGVYFEKILKSTTQSLWIRNIQLAISGTLMGLVCVFVLDGEAVSQNGFFQGYSTLIWVVVLQQAGLGLVVSLVIKYADNILKGFASAISIVLSSFASYLFLGDLTLSCLYFIGAFLVMGATFLYSMKRQEIKQNGIQTRV